MAAALPLLPGGRAEPSRKMNGSRLVGISRPSWIVRTESKAAIRKPVPPCARCGGTGRLDCHNCQGRGRTNCVHLAMLPRGEWPKWCRTCGGSGLQYCSRCLGTGEYRDTMGFHFISTITSNNHS